MRSAKGAAAILSDMTVSTHYAYAKRQCHIHMTRELGSSGPYAMLFCLDGPGKKKDRDVINFTFLLLFSRHNLGFEPAQYPYMHTVRPRLSGPRLSGSLAIRKKIVGYKCTAYAMLTYSMCVRLSGSLAYPDIFVENGCVRLCEV